MGSTKAHPEARSLQILERERPAVRQAFHCIMQSRAQGSPANVSH